MVLNSKEYYIVHGTFYYIVHGTFYYIVYGWKKLKHWNGNSETNAGGLQLQEKYDNIRLAGKLKHYHQHLLLNCYLI